MASTVTGTGASTGSSRKRKVKSDGNMRDPKRQKKETAKLENLKAELQVSVGKLKTELVTFQEFLLDENVAKKDAKFGYINLLMRCNNILNGDNPNDTALAVFNEPFADNFESEDVLRSRMSPSVLLHC